MLKFPLRYIESNTPESQFYVEYSVLDAENTVVHIPLEKWLRDEPTKELAKWIAQNIVQLFNQHYTEGNQPNNFCEPALVKEEPKKRGNPNWIKGASRK